jgi:hypothetical protein
VAQGEGPEFKPQNCKKKIFFNDLMTRNRIVLYCLSKETNLFTFMDINY